jgi:uncharacterized protein (UPF0262 family)
MALVELHIREKIIWESFKSQKQLNVAILKFISDNKIDKIVFKGDPYDLNYKLLKKILSGGSKDGDDKKEDSPLVYNGDYRGAFRKIIKMTNYDPLCIIYKVPAEKEDKEV